MKHQLILLGAICVILVAAVGILIRENMLNTEVIRDFDSANLALAYGLLSDGLTSNRVDVFAGDDAPAASYIIGDFTVRVVPLTINTNTSTWGLVNFLAHNHQAVLMHACHMWELDRNLAIAQLTLLYNLRPEAQAILDDYHANGILTSIGKSIIDLHESQWIWFTQRFQQQTKDSSNQPLHGTSLPRRP